MDILRRILPFTLEAREGARAERAIQVGSADRPPLRGRPHPAPLPIPYRTAGPAGSASGKPPPPPEPPPTRRAGWLATLGANLKDIAVLLAVIGGVLIKSFIDRAQANPPAGLDALQVVIGIGGSMVLFLGLRDKLPGGTVVYQVIWAAAWGYGGGAVGGDIAEAT